MLKRDTWLWIAVLAGPLAWVLHLTAAFLFVPLLCDEGLRWPLHLISGITLVVAIFGGLVGVSLLHLEASREKFMARLGVGSSILFTVAIAAGAIPIFILGCALP